jgi:hypothetical protein
MSRNLRSLIALGQVIAERELSFEKPGEPARTIRVQASNHLGTIRIGVCDSRCYCW